MRRRVVTLTKVALFTGLVVTTTLLMSITEGIGKGPEEREKDKEWLLKPSVFNMLSSAGKRTALLLNDKLPTPSHRDQTVSPDIMPLAGPDENIRLNNPALDRDGRTQNETSVAANGSNIIVSFNDTGGIFSVLREINLSGYAISFNSGISFTHKRIPIPFQGANLGDGVVVFGPNNEAYYATLAFTAGRFIIGVAKSSDRGANFTQPIDASTTAGNPEDFQDKEWIAVDRGEKSPFKGNVYVSWTTFKAADGSTTINFARSTNNGTSYGAPVALSRKGAIVQGSMPAVAPNGDVYVVYEELLANQILFVKSTDGGITFGEPQVAARFNSVSFSQATGGNGVRIFSFPSITIDKNGVIHMVYAAAAAIFARDRGDVFYVRSSDGGKSFSLPRKINDDGTLTTQINPSIATTADGKLGVKWWDRRNDPTNDSLTDVYMAISSDGGNSFGRNIRITNHNWAFGPKEPQVAEGYHGDYDAIIGDGNNFYLSWSDERNANPDVYFARVPSDSVASADFNISAMTTFNSVVAGESVNFEFQTSGIDNFKGDLALDVILPPSPGISSHFSSPVVTPGKAVTLTLTTTKAARAGTYMATAIASSGTIKRKTNFRLTIYPSVRRASMPINITRSSGPSRANGLQMDDRGILHMIFEDSTAVAGGSAMMNSFEEEEAERAETSGNASDDSFDSEIFYTQSIDGGKSFTEPVKLSTNSTSSSGARLALDPQGNLYAIWGSRTGNQTDIFLSISKDRGKSFSPPVSIIPAANGGVNRLLLDPKIGIDNRGNILIAYSDLSNQQNLRMFVTRSTDAGATFTAPVQVSREGENVQASQILFNSKGTAYIVYNDIGMDSRLLAPIKLAIAADGQRFIESKLVSVSPRVIDLSPQMAIDKDDNIYLVFAKGNSEILITKSTDGGFTFGRQLNISGTRGASASPSFILDKRGNINIVWDDNSGDGINPDIMLARSTDQGDTFTQPFNLNNLSANSGVSARPQGVADENGNLFIAWTDDSNANPEVFFCSVPLVGIQQPKLTVTGFSPSSEAVGGQLTIFGTQLQGVTTVAFSNNVVVPSNDFTITANGSQLTVKVPPGAVTGPVTVFSPLGIIPTSTSFIVASGNFSLTANPLQQKITPGSSANFTINVDADVSFLQPIILKADAPNSNITTSLSAVGVAPGNIAVLTVKASTTAPTNTIFNIDIVGKFGDFVRTQRVAVNVDLAPDFSLLLNPSQVTVARGKAFKLDVNINRVGGFSGDVTVSAPDAKELKIKVSPESQTTASGIISFRVRVKPDAPTGAQKLIFVAKDVTGRTHIGELTLMIK
ncbi:MAG: hypothetical protein AB1489_20975 [Acidobacteriota bacterium]